MSRYPLSRHFRTALVTGASAGIGRAIAEMLVTEGVEVWGTSRRPETAEGSAAVHWRRLDLGDGPDGALRLVGEVEAESSGLDLLVHCAGYGLFGSLLDLGAEAWARQLDDMVGSSLALNRAALAAMVPRGRGVIVNVTSMAVEFPIPYMSGYNMAKAALAALTESLMLESPGAGIRLLDFRPGDYRTGFNASMFTTPIDRLPAEQRRVAMRLEATLAASPAPERAARDLRRALAAGRSGVVRSGSFFQTVLAPFGARLIPVAWRRAAIARYFRRGAI